MTDIERATRAQEWLKEHHRLWVSLDSALRLVRFIDEEPKTCTKCGSPTDKYQCSVCGTC